MSTSTATVSTVGSAYRTTVGLEIHAELKTKSKMFCGCKNAPHDSEVNANVCPVCMAHPGSLPVVNKTAVQFLLMVGTAIKGELANYSEFDRKNYFYPDIPKAYQISQYQFPFVTKGELDGIAITRVHLEEDTARSQHDKGDDSVVDYNRAGVPLMELVTEPVIRTGSEAATFAKELQLLLRILNASSAHMEKGEMRVEANISVSKTKELGTKVEVKNLNSFKAVEQAIEFETLRQIELIEKGEFVTQETRGWDENKGKTFSQRKKETAHDYRYFPDPDIPKFQRSNIEEFSNSRLSEIMPILPHILRTSYRDLGLADDQIEIILSDVHYIRFFDRLIQSLDTSVQPRTVANYFLSDVLSQCSDSSQLETSYPEKFSQLLHMLASAKINSRVAKDLIDEVLFKGLDPEELAKNKGLLQLTSDDDLIPLVVQVIGANPEVVAELKNGKEASLQFLVGQGMKLSKGSANPVRLAELFKSEM